MSYAQSILPEFDHEMASTRKVLEQLPDDKLEWKAHANMHTIGWNANHLAEIPAWVEGTLKQDAWDIAPSGSEPYQSPKLTTRREILELFDRNVAAAQGHRIGKGRVVGEIMVAAAHGTPMFTMPRASVIRNFVLNHMVHHRAYLCAYLRMNDIAVPGMYGPG